MFTLQETDGRVSAVAVVGYPSTSGVGEGTSPLTYGRNL